MNAMIARIKLLGRMDVVEKRRPLDGRIKTRNPRGDEVEMRLSTLPTAFGEKMVMRIFDPDTAVKNLDALGFAQHDAQRWEQLVDAAARHHPGHRADRLGQDDHALLDAQAPGHRRGQRLHDRRPDRDDRAGVQPDAGAAAARPRLRRGPARADAAGPGHHHGRRDPRPRRPPRWRSRPRSPATWSSARCTPTTRPRRITRLIDLGVPPYLISATVIGVLAQRLVRTLCPHCKAARRGGHARDAATRSSSPGSINGGGARRTSRSAASSAA